MKLEVPTSYEDINIREYMAVQEIYEREQVVETAALEVIALLCGVTPKQMRAIRHSDLMTVIKEMAFLFEPIDMERFNLVREFEHDGIQYGFIPDMTKLTVGEFADIDAFTTEGAYHNLHRIMAVLYRPITKRRGEFYEIEPYDPSDLKNEDAMFFKMDVALGALVFFYAIGTSLSADTNAYLKAKAGPR